MTSKLCLDTATVVQIDRMVSSCITRYWCTIPSKNAVAAAEISIAPRESYRGITRGLRKADVGASRRSGINGSLLLHLEFSSNVLRVRTRRAQQVRQREACSASVLERDVHACAESPHLAVLHRHIELYNFRDAEIAQRPG